MKLFNTKTQTLEEFTPRDGEVTLYVCGITPYDTTHLGHAFTYASYDHLVRYLERKGLRVRYTQNVTDIDDDILKRAKETGENWRELGDRWTNHFIDDMVALNVRPPDEFPRATGVIPDIQQLVGALLRAGLGYEKNGSVYYEVRRYPDFGQLSHLPKDQMLDVANERGNFPNDPNKRDPLDFVLWQAQAPGEPAWDSPWGPGRPGWHIECSTMSTRFLGRTVDIHGGGLDLSFPHHECELAQVQPLREPGDPYVRFWMHTAMVGYQGEKMSKSLGNLVMVSDLLQRCASDTLRLLLGAHHYRQAWTYEEPLLQEALERSERLNQALRARGGAGSMLPAGEYARDFEAALDNDLDTPGALRSLDGLAQAILQAAREGRGVGDAQDQLRRDGQVFGLTFSGPPEERVKEGWNAKRK